jgi:hypothetical protein
VHLGKRLGLIDVKVSCSHAAPPRVHKTVGDGIVLGADSASTIVAQNSGYRNSYFTPEELCNLVKGLPIGA